MFSDYVPEAYQWDADDEQNCLQEVFDFSLHLLGPLNYSNK